MNWSEKCEGPGEGDRRGALCTGFTLVIIIIIIIKLQYYLYVIYCFERPSYSLAVPNWCSHHLHVRFPTLFSKRSSTRGWEFVPGRPACQADEEGLADGREDQNGRTFGWEPGWRRRRRSGRGDGGRQQRGRRQWRGTGGGRSQPPPPPPPPSAAAS